MFQGVSCDTFYIYLLQSFDAATSVVSLQARNSRTSASCLGTVMVIDEKALPLTRAWCLFEVLQTLSMSSQHPHFQGRFCCQSHSQRTFCIAMQNLIKLNQSQRFFCMKKERWQSLEREPNTCAGKFSGCLEGHVKK